MKYAFRIGDVFSSAPFGGNQLAVLPDAVGISTAGMQKIARELNFGERKSFGRRELRRSRDFGARIEADRTTTKNAITIQKSAATCR
jgi:PhzF family phenazine biosynthesis protein